MVGIGRRYNWVRLGGHISQRIFKTGRERNEYYSNVINIAVRL